MKIKYSVLIILMVIAAAVLSGTVTNETKASDHGMFFLNESEITIDQLDDSWTNRQYCLRNESGRGDVHSIGNEIVRAVSNDTSILKLNKVDGGSESGGIYPYWEIIPVKSGTTTIDCYDAYGNSATLKVNINFTVRPMKLSENTLQIDCKDDDATPKTIGNDTGCDIYRLGPRIMKVTSQNEKIVRVERKEGDSSGKEKNYYWNVIPGLSGTAYLKCEDNFGQSLLVSVKVNRTFNPFKLNKDYVKINRYSKSDNTVTIGQDSYSTVYPVSGPTIKRVTSQDERIVSIKRIKDSKTSYWELSPGKTGKTTIKCEDGYGQFAYVDVKMDNHELKLNRKKFTIDWYEPGDDGKAWIGNNKGCDIRATDSKIERVKVGNTKILSVAKGWYNWMINPKKTGTTTIECFDSRGNKASVNVTVSKKYFEEFIAKKTSLRKITYGDTRLHGKTVPGSNVTVKIAGKKYKTRPGKSGKFGIRMPVRRIGTKVICSIKYKKTGCKVSKKIAKPKVSIKATRLFRYSRNIKVKISKVNKGDNLKFKIGNRYYSKKIKPGKKKYVIRLNGGMRAGSRAKISVENKFKQRLNSKRVKVYYAAKLRVGMTKKQCRLVPGWDGDYTEPISGIITQWWYNETKFLTFYKGKLQEWGT